MSGPVKSASCVMIPLQEISTEEGRCVEISIVERLQDGLTDRSNSGLRAFTQVPFRLEACQPSACTFMSSIASEGRTPKAQMDLDAVGCVRGVR